MNVISFIFDVLRKIAIFFLSMIVLILVIVYNYIFPMLHDANNVMLWIIIVPLAMISCLMKWK